ncbi:M48 family metallopeptidase [filamentous cyanobacterium LEGE 11480]|uniref:M48 family metallopeptidase n=1 Tax=Romeriopsis navalis LEGE 11480 TaxID=2777977 RepID=A0A928VJW6_9CYAN|nr:M48 family metallopeptidase [Romeriopsis navalis]MBE9028992.1 M48 family metallopeptidase [Romeriopsis navalis LEGE 11480]
MGVNPVPLLGLKADQFRHPLDRQATNNLKQFPGFDFAIRSLLGSVTEQFFYMENISSSILVGEQQLPWLHKLLLDACATLDLEVPQLYVRQNPVPNAYTMAMRGKQPFIMMHTALLDLLEPAEIQAVIAHELGHLKCEHGVYLTLANLIVLASNQLPLPWGPLVTQGLQSQMMTWVRCAEFSCDRAALLATQDPQITMSVMMKLCGGSPQLAKQLNLDAFIAQARAYDAASQTDLGGMLKEMQTAQRTHPLPVLRAKEIDRWASTAEYQNLVVKHSTIGYTKSRTTGEWWNW